MNIEVTFTQDELEALAEAIGGVVDLIRDNAPPPWFDKEWKINGAMSAREKVLHAWLDSRM